MSGLTEQDLQTLLDLKCKEVEDAKVQITAMKKYIKALEYCSDEAEVYHRLRDEGVELEDLKKEAGL